MFYSVVLIEDQTNLCIPAQWIFCLDIVKGQKYGLNHNEKKRVFFSKNLAVVPNFLLPLRRIFDPNENGCYLAKIKDVFYTIVDCKEAMKKYRGGLPVVYNTIRYPETSPLFLASENSVAQEFDRQQIIKVEVEKQVVLLRNQLCDLTEECIDLTMNDSDEEEDVENTSDALNLELIMNGGEGASAPARQNIVGPPSNHSTLTERRAHGEGTSAEARQNIFVSSIAPVKFCAKIQFPVSIKNNNYFFNEKAYESGTEQQNNIAVSMNVNREQHEGALAPGRQNIVVPDANSILAERHAHNNEGTSAEAEKNMFVPSSAPVNFCAKIRFPISVKNISYFVNGQAYESGTDQQNNIAVSTTENRDQHDDALTPARQNIVVPLAYNSILAAEARQNMFVSSIAPVNFCAKIRFPDSIKYNNFSVNEKAYASGTEQQNYIAVSTTVNRDQQESALAPARQNIMISLAFNSVLTERSAHGEGTSAEAEQNTFVQSSAPVNICAKIRFPVSMKNDNFSVNEKAYESRTNQQNYIAVSTAQLQLQIKREVQMQYQSMSPHRASVIFFKASPASASTTAPEAPDSNAVDLKLEEPIIKKARGEIARSTEQQTIDDLSGGIHFELSPVILQITLHINIMIYGYRFLFSKVNQERFYPEANAHIDAITVLLLDQYNKTKNFAIHDERFVYFILWAILSEDEKKCRCTDKQKIALAQKIFLHRLRGAADASERASKFKEHCKLQVREIRQKSRKMDKQ